MDRSELPPGWDGALRARPAVVPVLLLGLVAIGAAVAVHPRRTAALAWAGATLALGGGALALAAGAGADFVPGDSSAATAAAHFLDSISGSLVTQSVVIAGVGVALFVASLVGGWSTRARAPRTAPDPPGLRQPVPQ
jgi:hypothetical protein